MCQLYWEDLTVGTSDRSPGRTIMEADLAAFAGLSGDYNQIHMDVVHAAEYGLGGERVVHGLLGMTVMSGLFTRTEIGAGLQRQLVAMLGIDWKFERPLRVGDTVHVEARVTEARATSRPERGIIVLRRELIDQHGDVIQSGTTPMMVLRRDAAT